MVNIRQLAINYLQKHGYLIITPENQQEIITEHETCDECGEEINPFEQVYEEGFRDGRQTVIN